MFNRSTYGFKNRGVYDEKVYNKVHSGLIYIYNNFHISSVFFLFMDFTGLLGE